MEEGKKETPTLKTSNRCFLFDDLPPKCISLCVKGLPRHPISSCNNYLAVRWVSHSTYSTSNLQTNCSLTCSYFSQAQLITRGIVYEAPRDSAVWPEPNDIRRYIEQDIQNCGGDCNMLCRWSSPGYQSLHPQDFGTDRILYFHRQFEGLEMPTKRCIYGVVFPDLLLWALLQAYGYAQVTRWIPLVNLE